jgi:hypothetical protein
MPGNKIRVPQDALSLHHFACRNFHLQALDKSMHDLLCEVRALTMRPTVHMCTRQKKFICVFIHFFAVDIEVEQMSHTLLMQVMQL